MISPRTKRRYVLVFLVVTGIMIFLISGPSVFYVSKEFLTLLFVAYVFALLFMLYFILKNIKTYRKFSLDLWRAQAHTPMSALTNKHCPMCNKLLYQTFFAEGGFPQMYVCKKCGYAGPIGLVLKKKVMTKAKIKKKKSKKK